MAAIMLNTGVVYEVPATRAQINGKLATDPAADTTVGGVGVTFRTSAIIAVADTLDGLIANYVIPTEPVVPPGG